MLDKLLQAVGTATFKHSLITFFGTMLSGILGVVFFIVAARELGPYNFGIFSITVATLTLIADMADLGINTGLINFVSRNYYLDREMSLRYLKLGLESKIVIWIVILPLGWFLTPVLAERLFMKEELALPLRITMVGLGGALLFSFVTNSLQAMQRYWPWTVINVTANFVRLLIIGFLILMSGINTESVLISYILVLFLGFFLGLIFIPPAFLRSTGERSLTKTFFNYNKWIAFNILITAFSSRLDTLMAARFFDATKVGIYSVAVQLSSSIPQIVYAIAASIAPKIAARKNAKELLSYLKKIQLMVGGLALLGLGALPISFILIPFLYGENYIGSVIPFIVLSLSQLLFLLATPAHQAIFYYFQNPKVFVYFSLIKILSIAILASILAQSIGIIGIAWAVFVGSVIDFVLPSWWVIKHLPKD